MVSAVSSNFSLLTAFWTMLEFFAFVILIFLVFTLAMDIFRSDDLSGWGKAAWLAFILFVPLIGIFACLIARGRSLLERAEEAQARQQRQSEVMNESTRDTNPIAAMAARRAVPVRPSRAQRSRR
jgi:Phospholipase_D-nuclease N-terminal